MLLGLYVCYTGQWGGDKVEPDVQIPAMELREVEYINRR